MPINSAVDNYQRLFQAMAEELKLPLLQIVRQAELAQTQPQAALLSQIERSAEQALWLVDSYSLSQQLANQAQLDLEPVTVSATLDEAAHQLTGLAKQYNREIELRLSGRYGPVMAHRQGLQTAFVGLGSALIMSAPSGKKPAPLVLAAHMGHAHGVVAGAFMETDGLCQDVYQTARALYGRARQPLHQVSSGAGAGIFIADSLFTSMAAQLRVARHHKLAGLAATLPPSRQLVFI